MYCPASLPKLYQLVLGPQTIFTLTAVCHLDSLAWRQFPVPVATGLTGLTTASRLSTEQRPCSLQQGAALQRETGLSGPSVAVEASPLVCFFHCKPSVWALAVLGGRGGMRVVHMNPAPCCFPWLCSCVHDCISPESLSLRRLELLQVLLILASSHCSFHMEGQERCCGFGLVITQLSRNSKGDTGPRHSHLVA